MHSDRVLALRMKLAAEYISLYVVLDRARCQPRAQTTRVQVIRVGNNQADLQVRRRLSKIIQVKQAKPGVQ
jgi:hypothetical protein